jgi:hypothetical protein
MDELAPIQRLAVKIAAAFEDLEKELAPGVRLGATVRPGPWPFSARPVFLFSGALWALCRRSPPPGFLWPLLGPFVAGSRLQGCFLWGLLGALSVPDSVPCVP